MTLDDMTPTPLGDLSGENGCTQITEGMAANAGCPECGHMVGLHRKPSKICSVCELVDRAEGIIRDEVRAFMAREKIIYQHPAWADPNEPF